MALCRSSRMISESYLLAGVGNSVACLSKYRYRSFLIFPNTLSTWRMNGGSKCSYASTRPSGA